MSSRSDDEGMNPPILFHVAYWFVESLLSTTTSIWCGGSGLSWACQSSSWWIAPGLQQFQAELLLLGDAGEHELHAQPGALLLHQPRLTRIDDFLGHPREHHRDTTAGFLHSLRSWPELRASR